MRYGKHTKCLFQLGMGKGPVVCADWFLYFEIFEKKWFFEIFEKHDDDGDDDDDNDDDNYKSLLVICCG